MQIVIANSNILLQLSCELPPKLIFYCVQKQFFYLQNQFYFCNFFVDFISSIILIFTNVVNNLFFLQKLFHLNKMSVDSTCISITLLISVLLIQSNAATSDENSLTNSVISNYRIERRESSAEGQKLIRFLGFATKDGLERNDTVHTVELHPNDDYALSRCSPKAMIYELLNFQLQLYLSIEKTSFRPDLLSACERVEKCVGSMYSFASRSDAFEERLFSPVLMILKQATRMACNLERKESRMNINTIVDQAQTTYSQLMMFKNLMKTVIDMGLF